MSFSTHTIVVLRREQSRVTLLELVFVRRIVLVSGEATSFFESLNDEEPISIFCMSETRSQWNIFFLSSSSPSFLVKSLICRCSFSQNSTINRNLT